MQCQLESAIPILERTPMALSGLLRGLPFDWTSPNEGPDTWSAFDIIGHLIHGEKTDWIPRAAIILSEQPGRCFEPFDRLAQFQNSLGKTIHQLLDEFEQLRSKNLQTLRSWNLSEADLDKTGIHPEFGEVTLRQHLATWVTHDLAHLAQTARVMAKQYKQEVGPWAAYLSVLNR
jgi:DinB superfamily